MISFMDRLCGLSNGEEIGAPPSSASWLESCDAGNVEAPAIFIRSLQVFIEERCGN